MSTEVPKGPAKHQGGGVSSVGEGQCWWLILTRIAVAVALLYPADTRVALLLVVCPLHECSAGSEAVLGALTVIEWLCVISLAAGVLTRSFAIPAMVLLVIKAASGFAATGGEQVAALVEHFLYARGSWTFAAMHLGALVLAWDLRVAGSGPWSIDSLFGGQRRNPRGRV